LLDHFAKEIVIAWDYTNRERVFPLTTSLAKERTLALDSTNIGRGYPLPTL